MPANRWIMNGYLEKVKYILPAFIIAAFGSVAGILVLRWLLSIQFEILVLREDIWEIWIPLIFPWIVILLWLRKRFTVLVFKKNSARGDGRFFFMLLSWITIFLMMAVSQNYLTTATGKLVTVKSAGEIPAREKARYYRMNNFYALTGLQGSYSDVRTRGKRNQFLDFSIYFVIPVSDGPGPDQNVPFTWFGIWYSKSVSNSLGDDEKETAYRSFYDECLADMKNYNFRAADHFERLPGSEKLNFFLKAVEVLTRQKPAPYLIVLEPVRESFDTRNGNKLAWIFGVFGIGLAVLLFSLIWPGYSPPGQKQQLKEDMQEKEGLADFFKYFIPQGTHVATSVILDLNILVFLAMIFSGISIVSPNAMELLQWGANRRMETAGGEWWRLFTSMFLHFGVQHLALNMYGLAIAAIFIEPKLGWKKFFILYIVSGLMAGLASIWWYPASVSAGASGAIFGLFGGILALVATNSYPAASKTVVFLLIGSYVAINLFMGLTMSGVDNAAHLGGLVSGAVMALILVHASFFRSTRSKKAL